MFGRNKGPSQEEIVEARREEEAEKNHEIARINAHTLTLLMPTLRGNPALDFDKLKAPFTPEPLSLGELAVPNQSPIRPPHDPKWEKQAQKIAKKTGSLPPRSPAQIAYDVEDQAFTLKERERSAAIEEAEYQNRLRNEAIRVQVAAQHKQVEAFAHDYHQQNPSAIQHYFSLLFQQHTLPDPFSKTVKVAYDPAVKLLQVESTLPFPEDVPRLEGVVYDENGDVFRDKIRPLDQHLALFEDLVRQATLHLLYLSFAADTGYAVAHVHLTLRAGSETGPVSVEVQAERNLVRGLDLMKEDREAILAAVAPLTFKVYTSREIPTSTSTTPLLAEEEVAVATGSSEEEVVAEDSIHEDVSEELTQSPEEDAPVKSVEDGAEETGNVPVVVHEEGTIDAAEDLEATPAVSAEDSTQEDSAYEDATFESTPSEEVEAEDAAQEQIDTTDELSDREDSSEEPVAAAAESLVVDVDATDSEEDVVSKENTATAPHTEESATEASPLDKEVVDAQDTDPEDVIVLPEDSTLLVDYKENTVEDYTDTSEENEQTSTRTESAESESATEESISAVDETPEDLEQEVAVNEITIAEEDATTSPEETVVSETQYEDNNVSYTVSSTEEVHVQEEPMVEEGDTTEDVDAEESVLEDIEETRTDAVHTEEENLVAELVEASSEWGTALHDAEETGETLMPEVSEEVVVVPTPLTAAEVAYERTVDAAEEALAALSLEEVESIIETSLQESVAAATEELEEDTQYEVPTNLTDAYLTGTAETPQEDFVVSSAEESSADTSMQTDTEDFAYDLSTVKSEEDDFSNEELAELDARAATSLEDEDFFDGLGAHEVSTEEEQNDASAPLFSDETDHYTADQEGEKVDELDFFFASAPAEEAAPNVESSVYETSAMRAADATLTRTALGVWEYEGGSEEPTTTVPSADESREEAARIAAEEENIELTRLAREVSASLKEPLSSSADDDSILLHDVSSPLPEAAPLIEGYPVEEKIEEEEVPTSLLPECSQCTPLRDSQDNMTYGRFRTLEEASGQLVEEGIFTETSFEEFQDGSRQRTFACTECATAFTLSLTAPRGSWNLS